jgi:hypothetical protein
MNERTVLEFKWTISRGRETYGYNICSLYADGEKVSSCNGGGYDMKGVALGNYIARRFALELAALKPENMPEVFEYNHETKKRDFVGRKLYGLSFHDPNYDPGKAVIGIDCDNRTLGGESGKTVDQAEADGESVGPERLQAFYIASSPLPSERHTIPLIDGACGFNSVTEIINAIGYGLEYVTGGRRSKADIYILRKV